MGNHSYMVSLALVFCAYFIAVSHGLGYLRTISLGQTGVPRCMATNRDSSTAYFVFTGNSLVSYSYDENLTIAISISWPSLWSDKVIACAIRGSVIYVTRADGAFSVINSKGSVIALTLPPSVPSALSLSSPIVLSSYPSSYNYSSVNKFYAWGNVTNSFVRIDLGGLESISLGLGFIPEYGFSKSGKLYFLGKSSYIALVTEQPLALELRFNASFTAGASGVNNSVAYFADLACSTRQIKITSLDLTRFSSKFSSFLLAPDAICSDDTALANVQFTYEDYGVAGEYMYLYLPQTQTIYKIFLSSLSLVESYSSEQMQSWVNLNAVLGPANILVGYQNLTSQILRFFFPTTCPKGSYTVIQRGQATCEQCRLWTYPSSFNASCIPCPLNHTVDYAQPGVCVPCSEMPTNDCPLCIFGEELIATNSCSPCLPGFFPSEPGNCTQCPDGFTTQPGSWECVGCPLGSFASNTSSLCDPCPRGFYGSAPGICTQCPIGSYTNTTGMLSCSPSCELGEFMDVNNNITCMPCPRGTFGVKNSTSQWCEICPSGTAGNVTGLRECYPCESGTYSNSVLDSTTCFNCPDKYYSQARSSQCIPCPPGTRANGERAAACIPCEEGSVSESLSRVCQKCTKGTVQISKSECKACVPGTYSIDPTKDCIDCSPNTYSASEGQESCTACPKWHYSAARSTACVSCVHDLWGSSGCAPIAQILIGFLVPLVVILVGIFSYKFWWKKRNTSETSQNSTDGISMLPLRFRRTHEFEKLETDAETLEGEEEEEEEEMEQEVAAVDTNNGEKDS